VELAKSLCPCQPAPIGPIRDERVVGVADEDDPRRERDLFSGESVGIAVSVPALVLVSHRERNLSEPWQLPQDPLADRGVLAHEVPLRFVEWAGLVQDRIRDPDLPDVVEERTGLHLCECPPLEAHR